MLFANQNVIVGPRTDPANISGLTDATEAIRRIGMHPNSSIVCVNSSEPKYTIKTLIAAAEVRAFKWLELEVHSLIVSLCTLKWQPLPQVSCTVLNDETQ